MYHWLSRKATSQTWRYYWYRFGAGSLSFSPCHVLQRHPWTSWFPFSASASPRWHLQFGQIGVPPLSCSISLSFASHRMWSPGTKVCRQTQVWSAGPRRARERSGRTYHSTCFHNQAVECYNERQNAHHPRWTRPLSSIAGFGKCKDLKATPSLQWWSSWNPFKDLAYDIPVTPDACLLFFHWKEVQRAPQWLYSLEDDVKWKSSSTQNCLKLVSLLFFTILFHSSH